MKTQQEIVDEAKKMFPEMAPTFSVHAACIVLTLEIVEDLKRKGVVQGGGYETTPNAGELSSYLKGQRFDMTDEQMFAAMDALNNVER